MAVFSDATSKDGLIERFEFWTRMKDGSVTGTLLKQVTSRINAGFERIMPILLSHSDFIRWDDINNSDRPIGTINIVSGQSDYTIAEDDNSLDILNVNAVKILTGASETEYQPLTKLTLDDPRALDAMSPNPSSTGTPDAYVENGQNLFFTPTPDYAVAAGIKIFFQREHSYFASTDTTKEAGIPKPFHELLVLHASFDWLSVNRSEDVSLLNIVKGEINRMEKELSHFIDMRNPTKLKMTMKPISFR